MLVIAGPPWATCYAVIVVFIVIVAADIAEAQPMRLFLFLSSQARERLRKLEGAWGAWELAAVRSLAHVQGTTPSPSSFGGAAAGLNGPVLLMAKP